MLTISTLIITAVVLVLLFKKGFDNRGKDVTILEFLYVVVLMEIICGGTTFIVSII